MKFLADLLFPKVCLGCGLLGSHICLSCHKDLIKIEKDGCFYCRRASFLGLTHPFCKKRYGVDGVLACFYYNDTLKKIIKNIKYRLVKEGLRELLGVLPQEQIDKLARYNKLYKNIILQAIPLYKTKKNQRGFNQSGEIIGHLSRAFDFPQASNLVKIRRTFSQSRLQKSSERRKNVRGVFRIVNNNEVSKKNFVLVDDVMTTGATVAEAAVLLKKNGAEKVFVFTLAKG